MKQEKALLCETCNEVTVARRDYSIILGASKWRCGQCGGTKIIDNDPVADTLLREAKILIGKNDEGAVKRLREIVKKYPETQAASAAEKMLKKLGILSDAPDPNVINAPVIEPKKKITSILPPAILKRLPGRKQHEDGKN